MQLLELKLLVHNLNNHKKQLKQLQFQCHQHQRLQIHIQWFQPLLQLMRQKNTSQAGHSWSVYSLFN